MAKRSLAQPLLVGAHAQVYGSAYAHSSLAQLHPIRGSRLAVVYETHWVVLVELKSLTSAPQMVLGQSLFATMTGEVRASRRSHMGWSVLTIRQVASNYACMDSLRK